MNLSKIKNDMFPKSCALLLSAALTFTSCNKEEDGIDPTLGEESNIQIVKGEYIVVFHNQSIKSNAVKQESLGLLKKYGITSDQIKSDYQSIFKGIVLHDISEDTYNQLQEDPAVKSVIKNIPMEFNLTPVNLPTQENTGTKMNDPIFDRRLPNGEIVPYANQRVGYADGRREKIWFFDGGIAEVNELNIDRRLSRNFIAGEPANAWQDTRADSHGTRVASIAAAKMNGSGIVGVAYGATVVSIRVFGTGATLASITEAYDYVARNIGPNDVWNMSGGPTSSYQGLVRRGFKDQADLLAAAIANLGRIRPGAIAAGNDGINLDLNPFVESMNSTANDNVYIVGAINNRDQVWNSSMFGRVIDYWAPGVEMTSIDRFGNVDVGGPGDSGTSFASPVVAAVIALTNNNPTINRNQNITRNGHTKPVPLAQIINIIGR
ncbi:S8 family serine peptidase [Aquimarina hainanensis]|uniref:S8 family serine peptidase n=1 Tax=Aquimarina hainanensis TaxID=1578017 RepID=A0ABW5N8Y8_9FLAO